MGYTLVTWVGVRYPCIHTGGCMHGCTDPACTHLSMCDELCCVLVHYMYPSRGNYEADAYRKPAAVAFPAAGAVRALPSLLAGTDALNHYHVMCLHHCLVVCGSSHNLCAQIWLHGCCRHASTLLPCPSHQQSAVVMHGEAVALVFSGSCVVCQVALPIPMHTHNHKRSHG